MANLTFAIILWKAAGVATAGTIYLFIDWLRRFFMPLRDLSAKYSVMQSSMASAERIFQLLDTEPGGARHRREARPQIPEAWSPTAARRPRRVRERLVCLRRGPRRRDRLGAARRVVHGSRPASASPSSGPTGAGKTTVLKLLTRLYEPSRGRILIDGVDLRELTQENLRRRVAMVLQDVFLFSGSVAENIALDRRRTSTAETVERASRAVQAHRFVELACPRGTTPRSGSAAATSRPGQRQLLSFARALAHGADVLVLDEATSSIDTETEALVQQGIHTLMEGRTAMVVAHRLSTIQDVDRIYVLEKGKLAEKGSHEELLARRWACTSGSTGSST